MRNGLHLIKKLILISLILLLASPSYPCGPAKYHLVWEPTPTATGYWVYTGRESGVYDVSYDVGNVTSFLLRDPHRPYIALKAYNTHGFSDFGRLPNGATEIGWFLGDINNDGVIDAGDYGILKQNWLKRVKW